MRKPVDKWLLILTTILIVVGFLIFLSASLGLLAREGAEFSSVVFSQLLGLLLGVVAMLLISRVHYRLLKKYAFYIFLASIFFTIAVFVPGFGFEYGGAERWLAFGPFSFQPAEFLKLGFIIYLAAWLSGFRKKIKSPAYGLAPFAIMVAIIALILLKQPDTGTFMVIFVTGLAMFVAGGAPWRHTALLSGVAVLGVGILAYMRPYIRERLFTFLNPALDPQGAGYQIQQSLIAIGSGELFGRGFGQSIQKFNFLPEPISDSIFAVFAEEFGFTGSIVLLTIFVFFAVRGLTIASRAPDSFSRLMALGIVILITGQAFLNIGSMIGIFPLTGLPLPFVSHGGTAMIFTLASVGILLNISRYCKA